MHWIALQPQPESQIQPRNGQVGQAGLADVWSALGWWALQFTPRVARLDDAVLLEVSADLPSLLCSSPKRQTFSPFFFLFFT